jgi:hypothetical protein
MADEAATPAVPSRTSNIHLDDGQKLEVAHQFSSAVKWSIGEDKLRELTLVSGARVVVNPSRVLMVTENKKA